MFQAQGQKPYTLSPKNLEFGGSFVLGFRAWGLESTLVRTEVILYYVVNERSYLEGQRELVSRLATPTTHIVTLVIPSTNLVTKSQ